MLGSGPWSRAITSVFNTNGHAVVSWRGEKIPDKSIIFLALPTQEMRITLEKLGKPKNPTVINGSKGIERTTHLLPYQIVQDVLGNVQYLALMGPSFAAEVTQKMPTLVNLGYRDLQAAQQVKKLIQTDYFRIKLTHSVRALELAGAFKNIYAIACGIVDGLGFGMNTRVQILLLAMEEFERLRLKLGYKTDKDAAPAIIGDLILTCGSKESRNFSFGKLLVYKSPETAVKEIGQTVEGYAACASIPYFERKTGLNLPLARFVYDITYGSKKVNIKQRFTNLVKSS